MNAKTKRIVSLSISILMVATLVLAALFALFGNSFTRKITDPTELGEKYYGGRYTSGIYIDEVNVGGKALLDWLVTDSRFVTLVTRTQKYDYEISLLEEKIAEQEEQIAKYAENYYKIQEPDEYDRNRYEENVDTCEEYIKGYEKSISEYELKIAELHAEYTEADFEELENKLADEKFLNSLGFSYLFSTGFGLSKNILAEGGRDVTADFEYVEEEEEEEEEILDGEEGENEEENAEEENVEQEEETKEEAMDPALITILAYANKEYKTQMGNTVSILTTIFGLILTYALIFLTVLFGIILAINALIKVIRLLKNAKNADETLIDRLKTKPLVSFVCMGFIFLSLIKVFGGSSVVFGSAYVFMGIAFIVDCISGAYVKLYNGGFKSEEVIKTGVTLVSAVLVIILVFVAASCAVGAVVSDKIAGFDKVSYLTIYEKHATRMYNDTNFDEIENITEYTEKINAIKYQAANLAGKELDEASKSIIIGVLAAIVLVIIADSVAICTLSRLGGRTYKTKLGNIREYGAQFVAVAFIIIAAVVVSMFTIGTKAELDESISAGKYEVFVNEYEVEGTYDNLLYTSLGEEGKAIDDAVKELEESLSDASDEEKILINNKLVNLDNLKGNLENTKDEIEETNLGITGIIVLAAIIFVLEIAYKIAPSKVAKLLPENLIKVEADPAKEEEAAEEVAEEAEAEKAEEEPAEA